MTDVTPQDIEALVGIFDSSGWDELRVVIDGRELYLSKNPDDRGGLHAAAARAAGPAASGDAGSRVREPVREPTGEAPAPALDIPAGLVAIRAPNLGTFYRSPKPGAPPYVALGEAILAETEICLIEVMKLFTPVRAGIAGRVRRILAEDSQLVEFDQPLFLIEPAG